MHADQSAQGLLNRPVRGSASTGDSQSKSCDQQIASSDSSSKESVGFPMQASQLNDEQKDSGSKKSSSHKREREPPDTAAKPEGKSLKTSGKATSAHGNAEGQGPHTGNKTDVTSPSGQSASDGSEAHWRYVQTECARKRKQARCIVTCLHGNSRSM